MTKPKKLPHWVPNVVESVSRQVIEHKLLAALKDEKVVAVLLSKQDLEDMIAALCGYELGETNGNVTSWEAYEARRKDLAKGLSQLLKEAF